MADDEYDGADNRKYVSLLSIWMDNRFDRLCSPDYFYLVILTVGTMRIL